VKVRAIALNTFGTVLRNKLIVLFLAGFVCVVLLMMTPILAAKTMSGQLGASEAGGMVVGMVSAIMSLVSGVGSLIAAWAAADAVASEMKSGTILAVMARPVRRWEFLLGKYLGVLLLMALYVFAMFALSYLLAWMGGQAIQSSPWTLLLYPMVRYAIYSALAILLVTMTYPVVAFAIVLFVSVAASILSPLSVRGSLLPEWLRAGLYSFLPSADLLSETRFLTVTQSTLHSTPWTDHLTALAYGLDYALVLFLLAVWSFRKRSLLRT
jgi:ABC-type transport system involved in multi-copper enzyme maturation permease subunit